MSKFSRANKKLKRAREIQARSRQKEQDIDNELKQLEQRKLWLGTLRKLNRGQYNDWLEGTYGRSIVPYCQTWNLQMAEKMQGLPVELRNFIYRYLWDTATLTGFPDLQKVTGGSRCVDDGRSALTLPHFTDPKFMGLATAREVVRALYDACHHTDHTIVIRRPEHIKAAVTKDVFCLGLDPGVHLRSIEVHIDLDRLRTSRRLHTLSSTCHHTAAEKIYTKKHDLKEWLRALLYIKHKSNFDLFVRLYQRNIRVAIVEEVLNVFGEVHRAMQARDADIYVDWYYEYTGEGFDWVDPLSEPPYHNMDDFYILPRRIWKQNMLSFLTEALDDDLIQPQHVHCFNEPCQHVSHRNFVHRMWDDNEHEGPAVGGESDSELDDESDSESDADSDELKEDDSDL